MKRDPKTKTRKSLTVSTEKIRELKSTDQLRQVVGGIRPMCAPQPCGISYNK